MGFYQSYPLRAHPKLQQLHWTGVYRPPHLMVTEGTGQQQLVTRVTPRKPVCLDASPAAATVTPSSSRLPLSRQSETSLKVALTGSFVAVFQARR